MPSPVDILLYGEFLLFVLIIVIGAVLFSVWRLRADLTTWRSSYMVRNAENIRILGSRVESLEAEMEHRRALPPGDDIYDTQWKDDEGSIHSR